MIRPRDCSDQWRALLHLYVRQHKRNNDNNKYDNNNSVMSNVMSMLPSFIFTLQSGLTAETGSVTKIPRCRHLCSALHPSRYAVARGLRKRWASREPRSGSLGGHEGNEGHRGRSTQTDVTVNRADISTGLPSEKIWIRL